MAYYLVSAKPRQDRMSDLKERLKEGAFVSLKPFGKALSSSLKNARLAKNGLALWEEEDYCDPPLKEERAAVLDDYFTNIEVKQVAREQGWAQISFLPRLFPDLHMINSGIE